MKKYLAEFILFCIDNKKDIGLALLGIALFFAAQVIFGGC